jgi:hypothetical protein
MREEAASHFGIHSLDERSGNRAKPSLGPDALPVKPTVLISEIENRPE